MSIAALLFAAQVVTAETVATCRVPCDSQQRASSLELPVNGDQGSGIGDQGSGNTAPGSEHRASEWMLAAGAARSVGLYDSAAGRVYAVQTIGWARELTRELKIIGIRGRFAWGVEATPLFVQLEPSRIYGVGFAPVVWRWNFPPQPRWSAFAELSMGGLWTSDPIPEETSRGNFTAHWGGGIRLHRRTMPDRTGPSNALVIAYRFQHFSNGNQLGTNPGVNSHVILAGWSKRS